VRAKPIRAFATAICLVLVACAVFPRSAAAGQEAAARISIASRHADFNNELASDPAQRLAGWALRSGDNAGLPFVIVDKAGAKIFVFDRDGKLLGATPALVGLSVGDESVPGIGSRKISSILPHERTTPAGRFVASLERSIHGDPVLWVDYDGGVALHRVIEVPKERRLQRLASRNPLDRRITYGCINVPSAFFDKVIRATFDATQGIVYVLPESRPLQEVFGSYEGQESGPIESPGGSQN
jgi:hypothetical protein